MMQSLAAIFLLRCLKAKNYYPIEPNADPKRLSEEELYLSLLIHHFMRVTYYNTHEITTTDEDTNGVGFGTDRLAMRRIGRATNPTLALLNHTCDPNYRRISVGRQVRILCSTSERTDLHSFLHLLFAVSVQQRCSATSRASRSVLPCQYINGAAALLFAEPVRQQRTAMLICLKCRNSICISESIILVLKSLLFQTLGFATKLIKAGEEITDTYCPTFAAIPKGERLQSLAKYNFVCNCTPCREDWPTLDQLPRKFHGLPRGCYRIESKEKVILQAIHNKMTKNTTMLAYLSRSRIK